MATDDLKARIERQQPKTRTARKAAASPTAGERGSSVPPAPEEARKKLTIDLERSRYRQLSLTAFELDCSRVEILRALLDEMNEDHDLAGRVATRIASGTVHRPKGFAARPDVAAEAGRGRRKID